MYPPELAPEVVILGTTFRVMDISEKGIRFRKDFSTRLDTGQSVKGVVIFQDLRNSNFQDLFCELSIMKQSHLPKVYQKIMSGSNIKELQ